MFAGFRLWASVIFMCIGSAMLSWRQTVYLNNFPNLVPADDFLVPLENQDMWHESAYDTGGNRNKVQVVNSAVKEGTSKKRDYYGLAKFREPKDGTIKSISLLGERNSGTRWIYG